MRENLDLPYDIIQIFTCLSVFIFFYSKDVRLPVQLQRAMAAEAEAAREARAKVCLSVCLCVCVSVCVCVCLTAVRMCGYQYSCREQWLLKLRLQERPELRSVCQSVFLPACLYVCPYQVIYIRGACFRWL